jgi:hypothetical protein
MRARDQLIGAAVLAATTYFGVLRIAEAKCDEAVGSLATPIDETRREDFEAFQRLRVQLENLGEKAFSDRLEDLRRKKQLWAAPGVGPDRWAAYVEALGLVRRIYIRRIALLTPEKHLYPQGAIDVPPGHQMAFAWLSLGGAMRHELAHFEGARDEADAYRIELGWYENIRRSPFLSSLASEERERWDWALDAAVKSVRKAAARAGAAIG